MSDDYIFKDHIGLLDFETFKKIHDPKLRRRLILSSKAFREDILKSQHNFISQKYSFYNDFFELINKKNYCDLEYKNNHLKINGNDIETFEISGDSKINITNLECLIRIPVSKNNYPFNLFLKDEFNDNTSELFNSLLKKGIPSRGRLVIEYQFITELKFEFEDVDKQKYYYTENPLKVMNGLGEPLFYKRPDELYLREGDRLDQKLLDSFANPILKNLGMNYLGSLKTVYFPRKNLKLSGTIYSGSKRLYEGKFDTDGSFPFFLLD